jgi:transposase InsO family protein
VPRLGGPKKGRRLVRPEEEPRPTLTPEQRLLVLDVWQRSGLAASEFSELVGLSTHTLYGWRKRFRDRGPEGLLDRPRGSRRGSRLAEVTKRSILMMKEAHPEWGCERISDMLVRGPGLAASAGAVATVLKEAGYELEDVPTHPHPETVHRFERSKPNQLWQTDIFTFVLKRQNRRVYLVVFLDDASRFVVGWGLHATASSALVIEVLRSAIASYGPPEEVLTDNGSQYVTWRGKSAFAKELERRGMKHLVSRPRHPQTLGKVERLWGSLWRECLLAAIFRDIGDARVRVGHYFDHYNFQRTHRGIGGLVPADRYFGADSEVKRTLQVRVAQNALDLARNGMPKKPFYLTGQVGGKGFSVHAEGERVILTKDAGEREEIDLVRPDAVPTEIPIASEDEPPESPPSPEDAPSEADDAMPASSDEDEADGMDPSSDEDLPEPGSSPLDDGLTDLVEGLRKEEHDG